MKFSFKPSNLLGAIYRSGNIVFNSDGDVLISPVGNKLTIYNLKSHLAQTLFVESRHNFSSIALSSCSNLLIAVNEIGEAHVISLVTSNVIYRHKFKTKVGCIVFSTDDKYFAVTIENDIFIYRSPSTKCGEYNTFVLERKFSAGYSNITWLEWSSDSRFIVVGCRDNSSRIYAIPYVKIFRPYIITGHTGSIVASFFEDGSLDVNSISQNGQLCLWRCSCPIAELDSDNKEIIVSKKKKKKDDSEDDMENDWCSDQPESRTNRQNPNQENEQDTPEGKKHPFYYEKIVRKYLADGPRKDNPNAIVTAANYHRKNKLLVVAFSTGVFFLYELPEANVIHSLKTSDYSICAVVFNSTGDWLALASQELGQLLVWEWQSEQYILKQQGHTSEMLCISYSPDGRYVASGGEDAKVKLWNVCNGSCFITFKEHTAAITDIQFSKNKKFLITSSLDGTVRAFDLVRYRNFRTLTASDLVQFSCVAIDYSCELVAAGCQDIFDIYMWSLKLGKLLEVISGHQGPISSLMFSPVVASSTLVTGSWDNTIKIWNCLENTTQHETLDLHSDIMAVTFHPNGKQVAVSSLNGNISFIDIQSMIEVNTIKGTNDLHSGYLDVDVILAKANKQKCFTSLVYTPDGECILAAGRAPVVCLYHVKESTLLKKFVITENCNIFGSEQIVNRRNITEFGNLKLIEKREIEEGGNVALRLPGVQKKDMSSRYYIPEFNVADIAFSPTAQAFAVACTEGLLIYSLDKGIVFNPFNLSLDITPNNVCNALHEKKYLEALVMSLKLNENELIVKVLESIPYDQIHLVSSLLPNELLRSVLKTVSRQLTITHHLEFYLQWCSCILSIHGNKENIFEHQSLLALHESIARKYDSLNKICDFNKYTAEILLKAVIQKEKLTKVPEE